MSAQDKQVCEQIHNLRSNLEQAEASFRSGSGTRGELDLMLAEAQMQHLKERRATKSFWARQFMAIALAVFVVLVGATTWYWARLTDKPAVAQEIAPPAPVAATTVPGTSAVEAKSQELIIPVQTPQQTSAAAEPIRKSVPLNTTKETPVASADQVHDLVRAARKTLNAN
ncbi:MAG: hypothetical protein PHQ45_01055 [Acidaminococcaceae bacterium]|nr:hypothetical protein [Acidaminococcaceae bacterium]